MNAQNEPTATERVIAPPVALDIGRSDAVAVSLPLDAGGRKERKMEPLHLHLLAHQHLVDFAPRRFGLHRVLIERRVPAGVTRKQRRMIGDIGLHEYAL